MENELEQHFKENWGKKCKEFEPECPACIAWKFFEYSGDTYLGEVKTEAFNAGLEAALGIVGELGNNPQPNHDFDPYAWSAGFTHCRDQARTAIEKLSRPDR